MTANNWLAVATRQLEEAGIGTARLDALVLLEDVAGIDRAKLLAEPDTKISSQQQRRLKNLLMKRARHEPLAYVRGHTEFYGRRFVITAAVLEPRPESETMIDLLKRLPRLPPKPRIADVGTGSGALGITAKLEWPEARVELLELDPKALKIAKMNVDLFTLSASVIKSDLLKHSRQQNDILLCNLPYVPDGFHINQAALREPRIAIFGGSDGLDLYRRLFQQVAKLADQPLYILTEALPPQHDVLQQIAQQHGYTQIKNEDFIQVFENGLTSRH